MVQKLQPLWLYMDLDAFFASVEVAFNSALKGLPLIIAGEGAHSVVSTCSYEARKFGVHSGMPLSQAKKCCPQGIFLPVNMDKYCAVSRAIMSSLGEVSPLVIQRSIDEAYLDISGMERLWGSALDIVKLVKQKVFNVSSVTCSCGVASTPYIAKIASDYHKPDGVTIIECGREKDFLLSLPLKKLYGVGESTINRLEAAGVTTTKALYDKSLEFLRLMAGDAAGRFLYNAVRGLDRSFTTPASTHSYSSEYTFDAQVFEISPCHDLILQLTQDVTERLLANSVAGNLISVKIRYVDFTTTTISKSYDDFIANSHDIYERAVTLFDSRVKLSNGVRLIGVSVGNIHAQSTCITGTLFDSEAEKKLRKLDSVALCVNQKYGALTIRRGSLSNNGNKTRPKHKKTKESHNLYQHNNK